MASATLNKVFKGLVRRVAGMLTSEASSWMRQRCRANPPTSPWPSSNSGPSSAADNQIQTEWCYSHVRTTGDTYKYFVPPPEGRGAVSRPPWLGARIQTRLRQVAEQR